MIVAIALMGCMPSLSSKEMQVTSQPVLSATPKTIFTPTETHVATATITATTTHVPTSTQINRQPITISTPSQKESNKITLDLLRTNNGCNLPCWWGIFPNETRWSDAEAFLKSFSTISELQPPSKWDVYEVHSPLSVEFSDVYAVRTIFAAQKGVVKEIETGYFDEKTYHLSSFLQKYGAPAQILVSTYSSDSGMPKNQVPLSINLYYPEKGINALYGTTATVNGTQIYGCIQDSPSLFLWSPDEHIRSIDYILGWDKHHIQYISIEQATGSSIQEFYEKYVNSVNAPCLQTPTNLWQGQ